MTSTREPSGISTSPIRVSLLASRPKERIGDSIRTTSLTALGIRPESLRMRSHWSGFWANSQTALPTALIVVSSDGAR